MIGKKLKALPYLSEKIRIREDRHRPVTLQVQKMKENLPSLALPAQPIPDYTFLNKERGFCRTSL